MVISLVFCTKVQGKSYSTSTYSTKEMVIYCRGEWVCHRSARSPGQWVGQRALQRCSVEGIGPKTQNHTQQVGVARNWVAGMIANSRKWQALCRHCIPHTTTLTALPQERRAEYQQLIDRGADLFCKEMVADSLNYVQQALNIARPGFGPNHPNVRETENNVRVV